MVTEFPGLNTPLGTVIPDAVDTIDPSSVARNVYEADCVVNDSDGAFDPV
jgi:hypothetical protein